MNQNYNSKHARNALNHSIKRAWERYELQLTEFELFRIAEYILEGKATLVQKCSNRAIFKVPYKGKKLVIVFDFILLVVCTLLPHSALRYYS